MSRVSILTAFFVFLTAGTTRADGLLYQLPKDGAWVRYRGELTNDSGSARPIEILLKSVGREGDLEKPLRWIELKVPHEDAMQVVKLLIPEKNLKEGEDPIANVVRGWSRVAEESPKGLSEPRGFWQQILLAGPLRNVQELEKGIVESKLGKLECEGLTGQANAKEEDGYELDLTYEIRRHPKAPFGVVACHIQCEVSRNGKKHATVAIDLELTDVGFDAESELPGYL